MAADHSVGSSSTDDNCITKWVWKGSDKFWQRISNWMDKIILWDKNISLWSAIKKAALPGIMLGLVTSIRVLGALAGVLIIFYFVICDGRKRIRELVLYFTISLITIYATWPYLWESPISNFVKVVKLMANNPQVVGVIFNGEVMKSIDLPRTYLPTLLGISLTEPIWFLFIVGLVITVYRIMRKHLEWRDFSVVLLWFLIPFFYVITKRPPMYDGFRHFLFILPPVFVTVGFFFDELMNWVKRPVFRWAVLILLTLPGVIGIVNLHPYEYAIFYWWLYGAFENTMITG
jgi:hypothetical protein